jgi:DNA-binding transcriptional LysR family regulator
LGIVQVNFAAFDLNLLRVLDAVLREGATGQADKLLAMSQPAVSGALSRLRHGLGDPLCVRHGNQV